MSDKLVSPMRKLAAYAVEMLEDYKNHKDDAIPSMVFDEVEVEDINNLTDKEVEPASVRWDMIVDGIQEGFKHLMHSHMTEEVYDDMRFFFDHFDDLDCIKDEEYQKRGGDIIDLGNGSTIKTVM